MTDSPTQSEQTQPEHGHDPVLMDEILDLLAPQPGETVVDCTVGRGGHTEALAQAVRGENDVTAHGLVLGFDLDPANLDYTTKRLTEARLNFVPVLGSFLQVQHQVRHLNTAADVVLADLGFSSSQMTDPQRGLSFMTDGPLDMRLDPTAPLTAADLIAQSSEQQLADLIFELGEEPLSRRIARKLVQARADKPILSTLRLAELVRKAYGSRARTSRMHPATRTFMALRIAVNDELGALRSFLDMVTRGAEQVEGDSWLGRRARIGIISFHSLEDRIVKHSFADLEKRGLAKRLTKKPVTPTTEETYRNPRARSAKLRIIRIGSD